MRILVDIGHPAHVHFFRFAIWEWKNHGHEVLVTARGKSHVTELLDYYGFEYILASRDRHGTLFPLFVTFVTHTIRVAKIAGRFRPDLVVSIGSPMAAWAAVINRTPHIAFDDTEHAWIGQALYLPFTQRVYTPESFTKNFGAKQVRYAGFHELAYLHPNWFSPNPKVLEEVGLSQETPFFVVRLVSWKASHDLGQKGFRPNDTNELTHILEKYGTVIVSSEIQGSTEVVGRNKSINPWRIHDLLYYATMYIGEGGTMATEAALLGTPAIFINSLTSGNWQELESKYGLMYSFNSLKDATQKIKELLSLTDLKQQWNKKRLRLLKDKLDVTSLIVGIPQEQEQSKDQ